MRTRLRVVLDTNVLVSASLQDGIPAAVVDAVLSEHILLISKETLEEYAAVLSRSKLDRFVDRSIRDALIARIVVESSLVSVTRLIAVCRDAKDDKFPELAANGNADLIISGDQDLLSIRVFENTPILSPGEFVEANSRRRNSD